MKNLFTILLFAIVFKASAQPNCQAFLYFGDTLKYEACQVALKCAGHYQFSREYQEALDEALEIDSTFAFAYKAKSTAYLKSGNFLEWKRLMDKAVDLDPVAMLDYRGWCRYQFFNDYEGAIRDIELLDSLVEHDIGYSQNGDYHLNIAKALLYKAIGQSEKAISIIEKQLNDTNHSAGLYDYLHLGVLYLEAQNFETAIDFLRLQEFVNDLAENRFYIALAYKELGDLESYSSNLKMALEKYKNGTKMFDPYVETMDKIFLEMIENELKRE